MPQDAGHAADLFRHGQSGKQTPAHPAGDERLEDVQDGGDEEG